VPRIAEAGREGERRPLDLELKLIADVGLIGLPNAGKSTLLSRITAARPKIGNYPFTTLIPEVGVVTLGEDRSIVVADIPGLIEGAHEGHGLGDRFLRHVERTRILLQLVDCGSLDTGSLDKKELDGTSADGAGPAEAFSVVDKELVKFSKALAARPRLVVATKVEDPEAEARADALDKSLRRRRRPKCLRISAATGKGLRELLSAVAKRLSEPHE
jgi:GTP-binding protein